jgi:hypothetical protein
VGDVVWVVEVEMLDDVVGEVVVLAAAVAIGVKGPGLTCSPAAATICHARTVVSVVAATQMATRPKRFTAPFSQWARVFRIKGPSRFAQGLGLYAGSPIP